MVKPKFAFSNPLHFEFLSSGQAAQRNIILLRPQELGGILAMPCSILHSHENATLCDTCQ